MRGAQLPRGRRVAADPDREHAGFRLRRGLARAEVALLRRRRRVGRRGHQQLLADRVHGRRALADHQRAGDRGAAVSAGVRGLDAPRVSGDGRVGQRAGPLHGEEVSAGGRVARDGVRPDRGDHVSGGVQRNVLAALLERGGVGGSGHGDVHAAALRGGRDLADDEHADDGDGAVRRRHAGRYHAVLPRGPDLGGARFERMQ